MRRTYFYSHLVLAHRPQAHSERALAEEVRAHFKKTLSVDTVITQLRERLSKQRANEKLGEAVNLLEEELKTLGADKHPHVVALRKKLEEVKKKIGPTGPLP